MKILALRLSNLNSLRGQFEVDFSKPPFAAGGLFAIVGHTGAGKTTLLDAVTLALYGRAARYGKDRPENMMSRHTGECTAEVDFACAGGRFSSSWQLQRAHKKPGGKLQQAKRRIVNLDTKEVLTQKLDESDALVTILTGLDYERFLRSVLLAQGDFAAFLKADTRLRTELLQQVTGTTIYQDISRASYRRAEEARAAHEGLLAQHKALPVFSDQLRAEKETALREATLAREETVLRARALSARLAAVAEWRQCEALATQLQADQEAHATRLRQADTELARLRAHQLAAPAQATLALLSAASATLAQGSRRAAELQASLPLLEERETAVADTEKKAASTLSALEEKAPALQQRWQAMAALDQELAHTVNALEQTRAGLDKTGALLAQNDERLKASQAEQAQALQRLAELEAWLTQHLIDQKLGGSLPDLSACFSDWLGAARLEKASKEQGARLEAEALARSTQLKELAAALLPAKAELQALEQTRARETAALRELLGTTSRSELEQSLHADASRAEQLRKLQTLLTQVAELDKELGQRTAQITPLSEALARLREALPHQELAAQSAQRSAEACAATLRLAEKVLSLESHRSLLQDGQPCPLCGALHHPNSSPRFEPDKEHAQARQALEVSETQRKQSEQTLAASRLQESALAKDLEVQQRELQLRRQEHGRLLAAAGSQAGELGITFSTTLTGADITAQLASLEASLLDRRETLARHDAAGLRLKATEEGLAEARSRLVEKEKIHDQALALHEANCRQLEELGKRLAEEQSQIAQHQVRFNQACAPFAPAPESGQAARALLKELEQRATAYANNQASARTLQARVEAQASQVRELSQTLTQTQSQHAEQESRHKALADTLAELSARRSRDYGTAELRQEQKDHEQHLSQLRRDLELCREQHRAQRERLLAARQELAKLEESQTRLQQEQATRQAQLEDLATRQGFASLETLCAALLPEPEVQRLEALAKTLQNAATSLATRAETLAQRCQALPADATADAARTEELRATLSEDEVQLSALDKSRGGLEEALRSDTELRQRQASVAAQLEASQREYERWHSLRLLIGSADGLAFARFAQGLTLEQLTLLANRHLEDLNPRYSLQRSTAEKAEELDLEIVDHYQADTCRPVTSLSGGESFLISLALALGVSELAGGRSSIETLFIDEGFGTLDPDSLEIAMSALENLQASGKTIGVISHVPAMQERISAQIRVLKQPGGYSTVEVGS